VKGGFAQVNANRVYLHVDDPSLLEAATTILPTKQRNQAADHLISRVIGNYD
jgi:hypothetical protein